MGLFDFLFVEEEDRAKLQTSPATSDKPGARRYSTPAFKVVLDNTESGRTQSWGEDGLELRGIKQRFANNALTGGTVLEGTQFIGSFSATVTAQTADLLSLRFTESDRALKKRLSTPMAGKKR